MRKFIYTALLGGIAALVVTSMMGEVDTASWARGKPFGHGRLLVRPRYVLYSQVTAAPPYVEYLFDAMINWTDDTSDSAEWEKRHHEPPGAAVDRYADIAWDTADASRNARQALDLIAIAYEESGFDRLVDDGTCNSPELVELMNLPFNCDHGHAHSIWQIWDVTLTPNYRAPAARRAQFILNEGGGSTWTTWPRARERAVKWWAKHPFTIR